MGLSGAEKQITKIARLLFLSSLMLKKKVKDVKFSFSLNLVITSPLNQCMITDTNCGLEKETSHFTVSLHAGTLDK